jgi:hypothetical protein
MLALLVGLPISDQILMAIGTTLSVFLIESTKHGSIEAAKQVA